MGSTLKYTLKCIRTNTLICINVFRFKLIIIGIVLEFEIEILGRRNLERNELDLHLPTQIFY